MQNLEGAVSADHPFINQAFTSWMRVRSDIEDAGMLEKAEAAGLCECWPYENYKNQPIPRKRIPPKMPSTARRSGHVFVMFDLTDDGTPTNIQIVSSTQKIFEKPALRSVEKWSYTKLTPEQETNNRQGLTAKITFRLSDHRGRIIPEDGY